MIAEPVRSFGGLGQHAHVFSHYASALGYRQTIALQLARFLGRGTLDLKIEGIRTRVKCRPWGSDRQSLSQALIQRDSQVELSFSPRFIIDGGANVGYASVLFANLYPSAVIVAVEPDAENLALAAQNCKPYDNVHLVPGGLWTSEVSLMIQNPEGDSDSFQLREAPLGTPGGIHGHTIEGLRKTWGFDKVDLLKLDIEGAEEHIFSSPDRDWIDRVRVLVIEVHGQKASDAVERAMATRPFECSRNGEKLVYRRKPD